MNLHQIAAPMIGAVNPFYPVTLRISRGVETNTDGTLEPQYETPGEIIASISGTTLSVATIGQGRLGIGQSLSDLSGALLPGTLITGLLTGSGATLTGEAILGAGSQWGVSTPQTIALEAMATSLTALAQVQPITWKDLQQLDGLNIEGIRWKIYLFGQVDGLVRRERKGGDLVMIPETNRHHGTWLVAQVLEQWPNWVSAAITLQNKTQ